MVVVGELGNLVGSAQANDPDESLIRIKNILDQLIEFGNDVRKKDSMCIKDEFDRILQDLMDTRVPTSPSKIGIFKHQLNSIGQSLEKIIRSESGLENHGIDCVYTFYCLLISSDSPSAASATILDIFNLESICEATKLFFQIGNCDNSGFVKVVQTLCTWLCTFSGLEKLHLCIIRFLDELRSLQKYVLLMEIADSVIDKLGSSLIIPTVRSKCLEVVAYILCSAQSVKLFDRIASRISKVFNCTASITPDVLIDLVSTFGESKNADLLLNVKPWHPPINTRDPAMPIGLVNIGNTCYMNSVLQALFMTKELTHHILLTETSSKIFDCIQELFSLLLYSLRQKLSPHDVLGERPSSFLYGHQQDSFEYLGYLLNQLHEDEKYCLNVKQIENSDFIPPSPDMFTLSGNIPATPESKPESMEIDHDVINPNESKTVRTMIQKLFGGRLSITLKCLNCSTDSTSIAEFFNLELSFSQTQQWINCTTQSLLDSYFAPEQMTNNEKYSCEKCKTLCDGERHTILEEGPPYLILVMKLFNNMNVKLLHKVHHDEVISIVAQTNDGCFRKTYKLYAVIVHCGTNIDSGHYYTFAINSSNEWYKLNDSHVSRTSFSDIEQLDYFNTPYILFYECVNKEKLDSTSDTTQISSKQMVQLPRLDELPQKLQDYVERDNNKVRNNETIQGELGQGRHDNKKGDRIVGQRASNTISSEFPTTLEGFGYGFNDAGELCQIDPTDGSITDKPFQFDVSSDATYNQAHYKALGEVLTEHVYQMLLDIHLHKIYVPTPETSESSFVFATKTNFANTKKLMFLIHGAGAVRAGQWSRSLIINQSINHGTQIPYIKRAIEFGYDVLVTNTNFGISSPEEHIVSVWEQLVAPVCDSIESFAVVAHSYGGVVTLELAKSYSNAFLDKCFAVAFTDSAHCATALPRNMFKWFSEHARNYVTSTNPLNTELSSGVSDIPAFSAGHTEHEWTSWACMEVLFPFLEEQYQHWLTAKNDKNVEDANQAATNETCDFDLNLNVDPILKLRIDLNQEGAEIFTTKSIKGTEEDLRKIVSVCDCCFDSPNGVEILRAISLLLIDHDKSHMLKFCRKLTQHPNMRSYKTLMHLFKRLLPTSPLRYDVYYNLVQVAKECKKMDKVFTSTKQLETLFMQCPPTDEKMKELYELLNNALIDDNKELAAKARLEGLKLKKVAGNERLRHANSIALLENRIESGFYKKRIMPGVIEYLDLSSSDEETLILPPTPPLQMPRNTAAPENHSARYVVRRNFDI